MQTAAYEPYPVVSFHTKRNVADSLQKAVEEAADPVIKEPSDAIIKVTSTDICGSDLYLYETMGAFMSSGNVLPRGDRHHARGRSLKSVPAIAWSCPSRSRAATAGCASAGSTHNARRVRYAERAAVPHTAAWPIRCG
jgi:threonine dehydrogenase-like Zn-dependent dehydrogenase